MISHDALISIFEELRRRNGELGVRELLDAARLAADRAMTPDAETLRRHLRLLWCRSFEEEADFNALWAEMPLEQPERAAAESPVAPSEARPFEPAPPSAPHAASEIPLFSQYSQSISLPRSAFDAAGLPRRPMRPLHPRYGHFHCQRRGRGARVSASAAPSGNHQSPRLSSAIHRAHCVAQSDAASALGWLNRANARRARADTSTDPRRVQPRA